MVGLGVVGVWEIVVVNRVVAVQGWWGLGY